MSDSTLMDCPVCHSHTLKKTAKVPIDIQDHYMACLFSGTPFIRTYQLYDGHLILRLKLITSTDLPQIQKITSIINQSALDLNTKRYIIFNYTRAKAIVDIAVKYKGQKTTTNTADKVSELQTKLIQASKTDDDKILDEAVTKFGEGMLSKEVVAAVPTTVLEKASSMHNSLCNTLNEIGFDENFYKGIQFV